MAMPISLLKGKKNKTGNSEMTFLEHLEHLRWHIIRALVSVVVFAVIVFLSRDFVFDTIIFGPRNENFPTYRFFCNLIDVLCVPPEFTLQAFKVEEKFVTHLKVSIILGIVISFPYIFWELWRFIKPGLYEKEQKVARGVVGVCSALFLTGILFGYYVISPFALTFLTGYELSDIPSQPTITSYVNMMAMFTLPAGITFELPMVIYFLSKVGLVTPEFLRKYRRFAVVIILVLAAIITPPDVITQFLIGIPLYVLYEISIIISKRVVANMEKEEQNA